MRKEGENLATEELECCEDCQIHPDRLDIVNSGMPEEEELYDLAELFKVFGDSTRIRILFVLFEAEVCVCDLAETLHYDTVGDLTSASDFKSNPSWSRAEGKESRFLFSGRRACAYDHRTGPRTY